MKNTLCVRIFIYWFCCENTFCSPLPASHFNSILALLSCCPKVFICYSSWVSLSSLFIRGRVFSRRCALWTYPFLFFSILEFALYAGVIEMENKRGDYFERGSLWVWGEESALHNDNNDQEGRACFGQSQRGGNALASLLLQQGRDFGC